MLLPELLICTRLSEADKRNLIQTKDDDLVLERGGTGNQADNDDDEEEDAAEDEDYFVGRVGTANTTLRKSAGYTLALFSKSFQEETYAALQPCIEKAISKQIVVPGLASCFHESDPALDMKEAGILVLGTICDEDGCLSLYEPQMSQIVPFLLLELQGESALIKATTLYTLQKFSAWTARESDASQFA